MKFGQFILRKIYKFVATRCQILRLKCTKFNVGWGTAPDPAGGGAYNAPQAYLDLRGTFLRMEELGEGKESGSRGRKRRGPQELVHNTMSEILNNTLIAELI